MPSEPLPEPIPIATREFDPALAQAPPADRPQCRALTVDGHRCKNKVLGGLHLCFSHYRNRRPALPEPRNVSVPLLEDRSAIVLMTTQILHGILSHRLDPLLARASLAALRIAALALPRPVATSRLAPAPAAPEPDDTVFRLGRDHDDFISADGNLATPELNPSCSIPESIHAIRELLDTLEPRNSCHPELEADPPLPDPTHDIEHCACFTCADHRTRIEQRTRDLQAGSPG
ncbi:MAG: hypothetical protein WB524_26530 [Acidobacteriaceae bacterium]|jgi:hypothetical protein